MRGVTLPARGWIACQKSVTDAGSIMVPVVRVVVPISGRPNGLKAGHGKPKRFPTEKTSRLRSFTCERTDMPGGAHQRCCAVTLATPGSLLPVLTPLLLQGQVQPAGQLVYCKTTTTSTTTLPAIPHTLVHATDRTFTWPEVQGPVSTVSQQHLTMKVRAPHAMRLRRRLRSACGE